MAEAVFKERREVPRVLLRTRIIYQKIGSSGEALGAQEESFTRDVSLNGLLFRTDEIIPIGTELKIKLFLSGCMHPIIIRASTVRIEQAEKENMFNIGVKYIQIEEKDRDEIAKRLEIMNIRKLLEMAVSKGASDLHLTYGWPPAVRIGGQILPLDIKPLDKFELKDMIFSLLSEEQISRFERNKELDFIFSLNPLIRFRGNVYQQRGNIEAVFRVVAPKIPSIKELGLPDVVEELAQKKRGMVIICGPTGSGKTTTLAAMVDYINKDRKCVIICLERPIEYIHRNAKSIIKQREVGSDTLSYANALRAALRQDPDVILVGELEDVEIIKTVFTAVETGHLVLTTIPAPNIIQAINRIVGIFPAEQQKLVSLQLSFCLEGIIGQVLLPKKGSEGRILATEVLIATDAVRRVIREMDLVQLLSIIQTSSQYKMHTMESSIRNLYEKGLITEEIASDYSWEFLRKSVIK